MTLEEMPIVLDNGAGYLKAGYAGESAPRILVPMYTTRTFSYWGPSEWFVGEHARALRREFPLSCPISQGQVTDFDELAIVWQYVYAKELRTNPAERPILVTEYPLLPRCHRERIAEMAFEKFSIPAIYFACQSVLSLYAVGLSTGLSVDIGTAITNVTPVVESYVLTESTKRHTIGGMDVTNFLQRLLVSANPKVARFINADVTRYFKEQLCYLTLDSTTETPLYSQSQPVRYQTPDGQLVSIGQERPMAPEILFNPKQAGLEANGIQHSVLSAIRECREELQPYLFGNIVLSGGTTMTRGFPERLKQELTNLTGDCVLNVYAPPHRKYSVWIGGSILGSLSTFQDSLISKKEFEEIGSAIVHQKCP
ncbi:Actin alpha skeletal muscle [Fasciolopsis buskii]|uniref:Actin alpha skeletal muscle n=1 Tax=Fasciolopsis buskii TaxID=27845 RepID=A0A8E0VK04_9TREM|nr:Actin alpha skeletal muscle [Fasciolopsis buski]